MSKLNKQGITNIAVLYAGIGIGFLNTLLKAKLLTPEEIGVLSIITSISAIVGYFMSFGVPAGILKYYSIFKKDVKQKTGLILVSLCIPIILCAIFSFIYFLLRDFVTGLYNNPLIDNYIQYIYFFFIGNTIFANFRSLFQSEYRSVLVTVLSDSTDRVLNCLFLLFMLVMDISFAYYFFYILGLILFRVLLLIISFIKTTDLGPPDISKFDTKFFMQFGRFCSFMFFAGMAGIITSVIDRLMIGHYMNVSSVGIYTVAITFSKPIGLIGAGFSRIAHPMIAEYWSRNNQNGIQKLYSENADIQLCLVSFIFILLIIFSRQLLGYFGKDYLTGIGVLIFISAGELINAGTGMCGGIIAYSKNYPFDLILRFILAIVTIVSNLIFIPIWGITGAAFATALSLAIYNVLKVIFVWNQFKMQPYSLETLKIIFLSFSAGSLFYLVSSRFIITNNFGLIILLSISYFVIYISAGASIFRIRFLKKSLFRFKRYYSMR